MMNIRWLCRAAGGSALVRTCRSTGICHIANACSKSGVLPVNTCKPLATLCCMYSGCWLTLSASRPFRTRRRPSRGTVRTDRRWLATTPEGGAGRARQPRLRATLDSDVTLIRAISITSFLPGGKRLRRCWFPFGAGAGANPLSPMVVDLAPPSELIHNGNPAARRCVDESDLRRGRADGQRRIPAMQPACSLVISYSRAGRSWSVPARYGCWVAAKPPTVSPRAKSCS